MVAVETREAVEGLARGDDRRLGRGLDIALGVAIFAVGFGVYSARWIDLFPLDEFRSWLFLPRGSVSDLARHVALVQDQKYATYAGRGVSMFLVKASANACDLNTRCLNATQLFVIAGSGVLLYSLLLRLTRRRGIAALAGLLWLFSVPVLDSISWQATINDKLAALFTLAGLNIGLSFFRRTLTTRAIAVGNVVLLAAVALAYNSKESAWVLVPSLALLAVATRERLDWHAVGRAGAVLVLPAAYAVYHFVLYTRNTEADAVWGGHIHDGNPWDNVKAYVRILANGQSASDRRVLPVIVAVAIVVLIISIAAAATAMLTRRGWNSSSDLARFALWSIASLAIAIAIPLRTQFHDGYYMVVPALFLFVALGVGAAMVADARARQTLRLASVVVAVAVVVVLGVNFRRSYDDGYAPIPHESANFTTAIRQAGRVVPRQLRQPVVLVTADETTNAYHFTGTGTWRDISEYMFDTRTPNRGFEKHFVDMKRSAFDASPRDPTAYYVVFDDAMRLERVDHGATVVYP